MQAIRELLEERTFAEVSVSMISERAGVTRSGFYFYFDSKYEALGCIVRDALTELDALTDNFAARGAGESATEFAKRMVGGAAAVFASNDPIMAASIMAQTADAHIRAILNDFQDAVIAKIVGIVEQEVRRGTTPISDNIPALVRILTATTAMTLSRDAAFINRDPDPDGSLQVLEQLWLYSLWGGEPLHQT